jgi:hypothetical protein
MIEILSLTILELTYIKLNNIRHNSLVQKLASIYKPGVCAELRQIVRVPSFLNLFAFWLMLFSPIASANIPIQKLHYGASVTATKLILVDYMGSINIKQTTHNHIFIKSTSDLSSLEGLEVDVTNNSLIVRGNGNYVILEIQMSSTYPIEATLDSGTLNAETISADSSISLKNSYVDIKKYSANFDCTMDGDSKLSIQNIRSNDCKFKINHNSSANLVSGTINQLDLTVADKGVFIFYGSVRNELSYSLTQFGLVRISSLIGVIHKRKKSQTSELFINLQQIN